MAWGATQPSSPRHYFLLGPEHWGPLTFTSMDKIRGENSHPIRPSVRPMKSKSDNIQFQDGKSSKVGRATRSTLIARGGTAEQTKQRRNNENTNECCSPFRPSFPNPDALSVSRNAVVNLCPFLSLAIGTESRHKWDEERRILFGAPFPFSPIRKRRRRRLSISHLDRDRIIDDDILREEEKGGRTDGRTTDWNSMPSKPKGHKQSPEPWPSVCKSVRPSASVRL